MTETKVAYNEEVRKKYNRFVQPQPIPAGEDPLRSTTPHSLTNLAPGSRKFVQTNKNRDSVAPGSGRRTRIFRAVTVVGGPTDR
jgi:hypothetical protein